MAITWHSLYLRSDDAQAVAVHLREVLNTYDYALYDPFSLMPGVAYSETVKAFVAPSVAGWVRVIGEMDTVLMPRMSDIGLVISAQFDPDAVAVSVFESGKEATLDELTPYLREGFTVEALKRTLTQPAVTAQAREDDFPMDALPDDLKEAAKDLNPKHINRMFGKLMKKVHRQLGGGMDNAQDLLQSGVDWQSVGGQRLRAFMHCLTMPEPWHTPDFVTLRDAYQLHLRKQRNPNAPDYPGDVDAMALVPSALTFIPVYGGK